MNSTENRPVFLNLLRIRQPVTAVLSILHRVSGVVLIILLPGLVYLLNLSLESSDGFARVAALLNSEPVRLLAVMLCWLLAHHLLAGLRFMLLDFDVAISRSAARKTAWLVHVGAAAAAVLAFGVLV
jgi:succinate dehydrogenase / fumarate reductase cytochrome b subunit